MFEIKCLCVSGMLMYVWYNIDVFVLMCLILHLFMCLWYNVFVLTECCCVCV